MVETPVEWITIVLSVSALLISLFSALYTRRQAKAEERAVELEEDERSRRRLEIRMDETIKVENVPFRPCRVWAAKFVVSNRSDEPVLLDELVIELGFHRVHYTLGEMLSRFFFRWNRKVSFRLRFPPGWLDMFGSGDMIPARLDTFLLELVSSCRLLNWEEIKPIQFAWRHWYRGPAPGEKQVWMLFGRIPEDLGKHLVEQGVYLASIECRFHTDNGPITVTGEFARSQSVSDSFVEELDEIAKSSPAPFEST